MSDFEIKEMPVGALDIDTDVQRSKVDMQRVQRMVDNFDDTALGTVTISARDDGFNAVLDGAHRCTAATIKRGPRYKMLCKVFYGLVKSEEARLFRLLNSTQKPTTLDQFKVRIVEGDKTAVAIDKIVRNAGFTIGTSTTQFSGVSAAEKIYRQEPAALVATMHTIVRAWGITAGACDYRVVDGIGRLYLRYGDAIDMPGFIAMLAKQYTGPGALIGKGRGLQESIGGQLAPCIAEVLVERYNKGRTTRAIAPWPRTR